MGVSDTQDNHWAIEGRYPDLDQDALIIRPERCNWAVVALLPWLAHAEGSHYVAQEFWRQIDEVLPAPAAWPITSGESPFADDLSDLLAYLFAISPSWRDLRMLGGCR